MKGVTRSRRWALYQAFWDLYMDLSTDGLSFEEWKKSRSAILKALPKKDQVVLREYHKKELKERASFYLLVLDKSLFERKRTHKKKVKKMAVA